MTAEYKTDPYVYTAKCFECEWHTKRYDYEHKAFMSRVDHEYEEDHTTWTDCIPVPMKYYGRDGGDRYV